MKYRSAWLEDHPRTHYRLYCYAYGEDKIYAYFCPADKWDRKHNGDAYFYNPNTKRRYGVRFTHNDFFYLSDLLEQNTSGSSHGYTTLKIFSQMKRAEYEALHTMTTIGGKE